MFLLKIHISIALLATLFLCKFSWAWEKSSIGLPFTATTQEYPEIAPIRTIVGDQTTEETDDVVSLVEWGDNEEEFFSNLNISDSQEMVTGNCNSEPRVRYNRQAKWLNETEKYRLGAAKCNGTKENETCDLCCTAMRMPVTKPKCHRKNGKLNWRPILTECGSKIFCISKKVNFMGQDIPLIKIADCRGNIYYVAAFNSAKKIPFFTAYQFTNHELGKGVRPSKFENLPCLQDGIDKNQLEIYPIGYQKGHLAPFADFDYGCDAAKATYFYINAAPQDSFTNQGAWRVLEGTIRKLFSSHRNGQSMYPRGFIITGVCPENYKGTFIPQCFWKLACTRTQRGEVTTAAFYHENTKVHPYQEAKKQERRDQVYKVRSQSFLSNQPGLNMNILRKVWDETAELYDKKDMNLGDYIRQCRDAKEINFPELNFYSTAKPNTADNELKDYTNNSKFELYHFWEDGLFGSDFNSTQAELDLLDEETESDRTSYAVCH